MKLFGNTGKNEHVRKKDAGMPASEPKPAEPAPQPEPAPAPQPEPPRVRPEQKKAALSGFFHAPIWKKLRIPAIVLGAIIVLALLGILAYSIWEKPPEVKDTEGPRVQTTVKPVEETQRPVLETPEPTEVPEETPEPTETPAPAETPEPVKTGRRDGVYTFVILVYDQAFANTDTILFGRLDTEGGTLDLVNVPRDTLVNVEWGVKKVNTILPLEKNDIERAMEHYSDLVGFTPDNYAVVNLRAVENLVDCIGGVYYNVPRDMNYDDPTQDLHIHINAGYQLVNGENAVKIMRFRVGNDNTGYYNGDLGRIATQQDFLMTMASSFLTLGNIPNLPTAIQIFEDNVKTDLTANNIAFFVREFLKLDRENIRFHTLPSKLISIRGGSYLEIMLDEWTEIVDSYLNPFHQAITADNLNILKQNGPYGAISNTGEIVPITSFLDFDAYLQSTAGDSGGDTQTAATD